MKILRRILIVVVVTLTIVFVSVNWIMPVALSFYSAYKAPVVTRVTPTDLKDHSISEAPGRTLSYFDYEFDLPWTDLDENQTVLYPKDKPEKTRVDLRFYSGLRALVSVIPPGEWSRDLAKELKLPPQDIESVFGKETMKSDYTFMKTLYEFTPSKMNHWNIGPPLNRDQTLLVIKSLALPRAAETGIFAVQNASDHGFQQGVAVPKQDRIVLDIYSNEGSIEIIFFERDYKNPIGVTQPEINRIIQSLHHVSLNSSSTSPAKRTKTQ